MTVCLGCWSSFDSWEAAERHRREADHVDVGTSSDPWTDYDLEAMAEEARLDG